MHHAIAYIPNSPERTLPSPKWREECQTPRAALEGALEHLEQPADYRELDPGFDPLPLHPRRGDRDVELRGHLDARLERDERRARFSRRGGDAHVVLL